MPSVSQVVISQSESARPSGSVAGRESGVPHRDGVLTDVAHSDVASDDAALGDSRSTIAPVQVDLPGPARKKRMVLYASVGVAAVAIAGLLLFRPHAGGTSDPVSTKMTAGQRTTAAGAHVVTAPLTRTGSTAAGAAAMVKAMGGDSVRSASATPARTGPVGQPEKRAPESAPPELRLPPVKVHLRPIIIPRAPVPSISAAPSVDSIVRSATERQRASDTDRTGTADRVSVPTPTDVDRAALNNAVTPAKIIGRPPAPRFPDALLRSGPREGQVVVRFIVNEYGSADVASMIVERSDHELFTAAVRDILPRFRFDPARTRAPESKPVASWVSLPFRFTTKAR
jgi:protein TonB